MDTETLATIRTPALGRDVVVRPGTSDEQVWADVFNGLYHLPPRSIVPKTVLDLGANIGLTAAHYRMLWPKAQIVAVEMNRDSAGLIERNAPGIEVRRHAVSAQGGWGSYDPDAPADSFAFRPKMSSGIVVGSYTLRQVIKRSFLAGEVDFVKMDIEGGEWELFAHSDWAELVRHLLVELHPSNLAPHCDEGRKYYGRDGYSNLLCSGVEALRAIGFNAEPHAVHPHAVLAWR